MTPTEIVQDAERKFNLQQAKVMLLSRRSRGDGLNPWTPDNADSEYRDLARASRTQWLTLVLDSTAQGLFVDGVTDRSGQPQTALWDAWQANRMDARQTAVHTAALALGRSFTVVMPGANGAEIIPKTGASVYAHYAAPTDDWPEYAVQIDGKDRLVYTDEALYRVSSGTETVETGYDFGHPPIVKFDNELTLLGEPQGEVDRAWSVIRRITETEFGLLMAQRYAAFKQRWVTGMAPPIDPVTKKPKELPMNVSVDQLLMAESVDTKFGQFDATDLRQYVESLEAHIRHLAAITQTPPHYLLGNMANLSADGIRAAESGLMRKISLRQQVFGEAWEQVLQLVGTIEGIEVADDIQVRWRDMEARSFSQTADALGKLRQMLDVPTEMLWERIPGWTEADTDRAKELAGDGDLLTQLASEFTATATQPAETPPVAP